MAKKKPEAIQEKKLNYFEKRMIELGITDANNIATVVDADMDFPADQPHDRKIFTGDSEGNIHILVSTIEGNLIRYQKSGKGKMSQVNAKELLFEGIRWAVPKTTPKGDVMKYYFPKGEGNLPFFPPNLQRKFKDKIIIETLTLTEGYIKAFKGDMHGMDVVGLPSITTLKNKNTGKIHADVLRLIEVCQVKKVVFLQDGDCLNPVKGEDLIVEVDKDGRPNPVFANGKDLYKRPNIFFNMVREFRELLNDLGDVQKYFAHIKSNALESNPKGLDDLLIDLGSKAEEAAEDYLKFSGENVYFHKEDITFNVFKVHRYFRLNDVTEFYQHHTEHGLAIGEKSFVFNGTQYRFDPEHQKCNIIIPGDANRFFRVGDQYYEKIQIPNKYGTLEKTFHQRMKSTITDDYGPKIIKHINKYKAFCNVPDHVNYQEVIYNCYNLYYPFEHEAQEDTGWENISRFIKHLFGTNEIIWRHPKHKSTVKINEFDLGLDYVQLLYQNPAQVLPILCLVSRENNTGKSTYAKFLRLLFGQNVAIVGNADLANDFNAFWASKLLVICDETRIDKLAVVEKVKSLSTADKIFMNAKGKQHVEIDFFAKFIFLTNNEDNFIYASEDDVRYWVRKVPGITSQDLNVDLMKDLQDEIPAFLDFLNNRRLATDKCHRAWFDPELIKTEALMKVVAYSRTTVEKELREHIREMFFDFQETEIMMSLKNVRHEFFKGRYEMNYLNKVITQEMGIIRYKNEEGNEVACRYYYPRWEEDRDTDTEKKMKRVDVNDIGRPYVFKAKDILSATDLTTLMAVMAAGGSDGIKYISQNGHAGPKDMQTVMALKTGDDLPF